MRFIALFLILNGIAFFAEAQFRKSRNAQPTATIDENSLNYSNPREYTVGGIEVSGLNILDKNALISLTGLRVGDKVKIPGDKISGAIRKLWKHGLVGDVSIGVDHFEGDAVFLVIQLAERPRLTEFYFTGISKGRQTALKEEIKLIRGKIVNDAMIRNTELSVKKFFVKKGFLNTMVKIVQENDTLNRGSVKLRINVDLNAKVRIHAINFEGNDQIDDATLRKKMKKTHEYARLKLHRVLLANAFRATPGKIGQALTHTKPTTWRQFKEFFNENVKLNIFNGSKFIKTEYDEDKNKILAYYNSKGFRDAEIVSDSMVNHSDRAIDIKFRVFEGRKYYFRNITWTGNYLHTANTLNKILDIKRGDVYNKELLEKRTTFNPKGADVSSLYMDDGYLFFDVDDVEVAIVGDSIDIEMRIFEGDQAILDRVIITGNERTSDHVIRRELSTIPGNKFRRSDIIRTQQLLSSMGYFNPQKIGQDVKPNPAAGTVDIEWKVEEQSNDQVQLSGGWGGYYGFVGTVGLSFNNFALRNIPHFDRWRPLPVGDGQKLQLNMQANGKSFQSYSISFTEPWLGGKRPNSFTVSLNKSISRLANNYFSYTPTFSDDRMLRQSGITIGIGRRLTWPDNYFTLSNSISVLGYNYKNYPGLPAKGTTMNLNLNTTLSRNSIDNPMFPTSGSSLSLSLTLTPPYSLLSENNYLQNEATKFKFVELHKWMIDTKFYLKLIGSKKLEGGRSLVLETKAHFGIIGSYAKGNTPGPFERFLLGGDGLAGGFQSYVLGQDIIGLRGYDNNRVTPPNYASNQSTGNQIQGGIVYNKLGLELRYPVTTSESATIYGFLFTEGGNNWGNFAEFNPFKIYKSAGAGVRLFMPAFGLIGLNWGYGFDTLPGAAQRSGAHFHFTIGQQIR
jgi:outer membrane protein insertion porin family